MNVNKPKCIRRISKEPNYKDMQRRIMSFPNNSYPFSINRNTSSTKKYWAQVMKEVTSAPTRKLYTGDCLFIQSGNFYKYCNCNTNVTTKCYHVEHKTYLARNRNPNFKIDFTLNDGHRVQTLYLACQHASPQKATEVNSVVSKRTRSTNSAVRDTGRTPVRVWTVCISVLRRMVLPT